MFYALTVIYIDNLISVWGQILVNIQPCSILMAMEGSFNNRNLLGLLTVGGCNWGSSFLTTQLMCLGYAKSLSLGQLDRAGCQTSISDGTMHVKSPSGEFLFSAFLHNGRDFLDQQFYLAKYQIIAIRRSKKKPSMAKRTDLGKCLNQWMSWSVFCAQK